MKVLFKIFPPLLLTATIMACSGQATAAHTPSETAESTATQTTPTYPEKTSPAGIVLVQEEGSQLAFYGLDRTLLGTRSLQEVKRGNDHLQIHGSFSGDVDSIGVMQIQQDGEEISVQMDGQLLTSLQGILTGFCGVEGQPVAAIATVQDSDPGDHLAEIHLVTPESQPGDEAILSMEMPHGGALTPIHIDMENGTATKIWYSKQPYALGGEIIFHPVYELYAMDLASKETIQYLPTKEVNLPAFSADGSLLAYVDRSSVHALNLNNGEEETFSILANSGHGAGEVIFSPDHNQLAWKEADGTNLIEMSYYAVLRIAPLGEGVQNDLYEEFFEPLTGYEISDIDPVAWVDGDTLLVSILGWEEGCSIWVLEFGQGTTNLLGPGEFAGFLYR